MNDSVLMSVLIMAMNVFLFRIFKQKADTENKIIDSYDIIADGFNDTYMATKRPTVS